MISQRSYSLIRQLVMALLLTAALASQPWQRAKAATDTEEQARKRAGGQDGNKGSEAALAGLEMVTLLRRLED